MQFKTNKEKGNTSLGIAIVYYSSNGYTVSIPLNDTQDYDLIVDKGNILKKVQVKSISCKTRYGNYQVALKDKNVISNGKSIYDNKKKKSVTVAFHYCYRLFNI